MAVNGAPGSVTEPNVSGCPPSFVRVKLWVASPPTGSPPKSSRFRLIERCAVASWPVPARGNCTVPRLVATVSEPARDPAALGLNRTGTESVPPGSSVVGSAGDGVPTRNSALVLVTLLTVTEDEAVICTVCGELVVPMVCVPNVAPGLDNGTLIGAPNASSRPSRVPT